jgi:hypothetical protein
MLTSQDPKSMLRSILERAETIGEGHLKSRRRDSIEP